MTVLTAQTSEERQLLVDLLQEAAQLEHCLLDAYLYTACSLKSTPQEFETVAGKPNRRRAIQHERARAWKQSILMVAHEEMLHLHYVQCLLRALGETPDFTLPKRDADGNWIIANWKARIGEDEVNDGQGVTVPVNPLTMNTIRQYVLYEATDSVQDDNPFGPEMTNLFERLHKFEQDLLFESMLLHIQDDTRRADLKQKLAALFDELTPLSADEKIVRDKLVAAFAPDALPPAENIRFQSIADFYLRGILPLYEQAFDFGWVKHNNRNLNNELLEANNPRQGFLPIGPVYRGKNFSSFNKRNTADPLSHYKNVSDIINEIVEEGEGFSNFADRAEMLLSKVKELGGARPYLLALMADMNPNNPAPTPDWLSHGEMVRQSHLYRFGMIMTELQQEQDLSDQSGVDFQAAREPISLDEHPRLKQLTKELASQFNASYLVMLMWLARMYEIPHWQADLPRRQAIEGLTSWPLMSMAIRPFLELISFFPVDRRDLFRVDAASLPYLPIHAQQLHDLYTSGERSEEINARMDYLAVRVLTNIAGWCADQVETVKHADLPANTKQMILTRLQELAGLGEFQKQFPFRQHGGFSGTMPDLTYRQKHPNSRKYEEDPTFPAPNDPSQTSRPLYQDTLALRIRFSGWGLVQLSTDPDPPIDEVGCTGTHMMHAADGDRRFDRSLVWQHNDPAHNIVRGPAQAMPKLGVNATDVSLVVTNGQASAGYVPLQVLQSAGAVQSSGVQQDLEVQGFLDLLTLTPQDILGDGRRLRIDLKEKNGRKPYLVGNNHVIWQDGEPIDPFLLAVLADSTDSADNEASVQPDLLFQREVYNEGRSLVDMNPLERLDTSRAPVGFDNYRNIPDWAKANLSETERQLLASPAYPMSFLGHRAGLLGNALSEELSGLGTDIDQHQVDEIVSYGERMRLISFPRMTTVVWLNFLLHYGHTVSGNLTRGLGDNPIFNAFAAKTNLQLSLPETGDRYAANNRWLVKYTKGVMDTDALSDLVYGELYIPVTVQPNGEGHIELSEKWTFPASMENPVEDYAVRFDKPFWAPFQVDGKVRTAKLPDGTTITETLVSQNDNQYTYTLTGLPGVTAYQGNFTLERDKANDQVILHWNIAFQASDAQSIVKTISIIAQATQQMTTAMGNHFGPKH